MLGVRKPVIKFQSTCNSVQFSRSVLSDSLQPHGLQHARFPCPSPTPGVHSDSRPSSQWCHPAISSSVVPFSSCPQSLPASESFPMSQLLTWGGQSTGVSALADDGFIYFTGEVLKRGEKQLNENFHNLQSLHTSTHLHVYTYPLTNLLLPGIN